MANNVVLTNFDYTYPGQLATEVMYKPAVMNPDTMSLFRVRPGIKSKLQLHLINPLGKIVKGDQGCGTKSITGNSVNLTNRTLEVCTMETYLEQCADVFEGTVYEEALRSGVDINDLTGTQIEQIIRRLVTESLQREVFRIFSFGDTTSPAGDPSYYGMCDGLWSRLFAGEASYDVHKEDTISSHTPATVQGYFQNLFEGAPIILKQIPASQKAFYVTGNIWEALMAAYESTTESGGFLVRTENGVTSMSYRGIPVIVFYAWDNWISTDNLGNNSRILYTTRENHVIGVEEASNQGRLKIYFDEDDEMLKIKAKFKLGYNYVHGELQAISYGNV